MSLVVYRKKRDFKKTPEPKGGKVKKQKQLRFVIHKHAASRLHYDLRLEMEGVYRSWAVPKGPSLKPSEIRLAVHVEDHPLEYGEFEGVIPSGNYGAGTVMIWDFGTYESRMPHKPEQNEKFVVEGYKKGKLTIIFHGEKLRGEFALVKSPKIPKHWLLIKKWDKEAGFKKTLEDLHSAKSGRTMDQIAAQAEKKGAVWHSKKVAARKAPVRTVVEPEKLALLKKLVKKTIRSIPKTSQAEVAPPGKFSILRTTDRPPLTHLNKIYWPKEKYTKQDLVEYYYKISEFILPYLKDRPESLHRQPDGVRSFGFFHKDMEGFLPRRIQTLLVKSASAGKTIRYLICQDRWTLLYLANMGCIELNPWLSRKDTLENPDYVVIDLDPDENKFTDVIKVAQEFGKLLKQIGVTAYIKTSGATGIHICVPVATKYTFDETREFALAVAERVQPKFPKLTSLDRTPGKRKGKIYLDCLQNRRGQTLAAPYCVRPVPGAQVSTPLSWEELTPRLSPSKFNIHTIHARVKEKGDLWAGMLTTQNNLEKAMSKLLKLPHKVVR